MSLFLPSAKPLSVDDKAWRLSEDDELSYDGKTLIRVQTVVVVREGRLVEFARPLGPAAKFKGADPFAILALGEDSAGEVMEQAHKLRGDNGIQRVMDDHLDEVNVIEQMRQYADQIVEFRKTHQRTIANTRSRNSGR